MSKIYDALIQGAKNSDSRSTVFESGTDQKTGAPRTLFATSASSGKSLGLLQL